MVDFVSVPKEPTDEMLRAWYETQCSPNDTPAGGLTRWASWDEAKVVRGDQMADCYRAMIAAAPTLEQGAGDGWRDISTAPRDGTHFLAYEDDGDVFRAAYHSEGYLMCFGGQPCVQTPEPTHWQPLPSPPASPSVGGTEG